MDLELYREPVEVEMMYYQGSVQVRTLEAEFSTHSEAAEQ